jgi:hypothetical protein
MFIWINKLLYFTNVTFLDFCYWKY